MREVSAVEHSDSQVGDEPGGQRDVCEKSLQPQTENQKAAMRQKEGEKMLYTKAKIQTGEKEYCIL